MGQGPTAPGPPPAISLTTPRKPATPTHQTPPLMFHGAAAVGAGAHGGEGGGRGVYLGHVGQDLGDGVGAGEDLAAVLPDGAGAADAGDLLDDGVDLDTRAQGQRYEPAGGLDLRRSAAPGLAHLGKDLAETMIVSVDRDVEFAAAGFNTSLKCILLFANERRLGNVDWVEEKVSGSKGWRTRELAKAVQSLKAGD